MKVELESVQKTYDGKTALRISKLCLRTGEVIGILGKNGAGKSTLLRLLVDLSVPDTGAVSIDDKPASQDEDWKDRWGVYLDSSFLIDFYTADEYLSLVGNLHGMVADEIEERKTAFAGFFCREVIGTGKLIRELSSGNRQKVGIAGALFAAPSVLILDEPFSDLDPQGQHWLSGKLKNYGTKDRLLVISSHNLFLLKDLVSRILIIENGIVIFDGDHKAWHDAESHFR